MNNEFEIVDGKLFISKELFRQAQLTDNNLSKLTGSCCTNLFDVKPRILTGQESIIIDYHDADYLKIPQNLDTFIDDITSTYHYEVRGKIKVSYNQQIFDVVINKY